MALPTPTPEEAARTIRARDLAARAASDRREREARDSVVAAVRALLPAGSFAWLIGSLAWGGFGDHSDVDLVVRGVAPAALLAIERAIMAAAGVQAELLDWDELPGAFQERIAREGLPVHDA